MGTKSPKAQSHCCAAAAVQGSTADVWQQLQRKCQDSSTCRILMLLETREQLAELAAGGWLADIGILVPCGQLGQAMQCIKGITPVTKAMVPILSCMSHVSFYMA